MKKLILLFAVVALTSSCSQYMCPTYSDAGQIEDQQEVKKEAVKY